MNSGIESYIRKKYQWSDLPLHIKQSLGQKPQEYIKHIVDYSIKNQLSFKGNLVQCVRKDGKRYYEELLQYSQEHLMLYPYHLANVLVKGLRITPFQYYSSVMGGIMERGRSYDSLPNFTAADCLRLLGIGRNEYIDLMNQCRAGRKLFRKKSIKDLLPAKPVDINVEPWWFVEAGYITEDDIKHVSEEEVVVIDMLIDSGSQKAGVLNFNHVISLYKKGLIYLDVPIDDTDYIVVPPLEGFVMNRVLGDYFETLLYKIFVSIDEHTSVGELATVLQVDPHQVKNAVSLYCRLGFARKKISEVDSLNLHPSWRKESKGSVDDKRSLSPPGDSILKELNAALAEVDASSSIDETESTCHQPRVKRIAFLFDSTLTAFLMMGNLSPGLKTHAVTMFEVGKLADESLESFLVELEKVSREESEGEAQRYFDHAVILRSTILFLRQDWRVDLVRCESLQSLDEATCTRLLNKNYSLLVSMAPLSHEISPITSLEPPHLGPAIPEINSIWFKLFIYENTGFGPPSLLLAKGTRLKKLPAMFRRYDKVLVTTWGHDPGVLPIANIVVTLNDALCHSAVLVQAYGVLQGADTTLVTFPFCESNGDVNWKRHPALIKLADYLDLKHNCGFVTMLQLGADTGLQNNSANSVPSSGSGHSNNSIADLEGWVHDWPMQEGADVLQQADCVVKDKALSLDLPGRQLTNDGNEEPWTILDCCFGVPLFDVDANKRICDAIIKCGLWDQESLEGLKKSSVELSNNLSEFIKRFQDDSTVTGSGPPIALPDKNLAFCNGHLRSWDGK